MLFVTTVASTLEAFLLPFARALRERGLRVDALSADTLSTAGLAGEFDQRFEIGWSRSIRSLARYRRLARDVRVLVAREGYETVWVHTPIAALVTRAALRRGGPRGALAGGREGALAPRVVYTAHGLHFFRGGPALTNGVYRLLEKWAARRWTDVLVVMNDEDEAAARRWVAPGGWRCQLLRIDGIGIDAAEWAPVTLDPVRRQELRERFGLPPESFTITMIAEMNANKRHELLIEAVGELVAREATGELRLLLVGEGPRKTELRRLATEEGLAGTVVFTGQLRPDELRELLALTDLGMLVSAREGLPRSLMELCAAGIPLAGTRTRGIVDEVADERALASAPTPAAIAELILRLAKDPALRDELARAQHARLMERYELGRVLEQYLELLEGS